VDAADLVSPGAGLVHAHHRAPPPDPGRL